MEQERGIDFPEESGAQPAAVVSSSTWRIATPACIHPGRTAIATILVIDDLPANRSYLSTLLAHDGHRVLEAGDGESGLAVVRAEHPGMIISGRRSSRRSTALVRARLPEPRTRFSDGFTRPIVRRWSTP